MVVDLGLLKEPVGSFMFCTLLRERRSGPAAVLLLTTFPEIIMEVENWRWKTMFPLQVISHSHDDFREYN